MIARRENDLTPLTGRELRVAIAREEPVYVVIELADDPMGLELIETTVILDSEEPLPIQGIKGYEIDTGTIGDDDLASFVDGDALIDLFRVPGLPAKAYAP